MSFSVWPITRRQNRIPTFALIPVGRESLSGRWVASSRIVPSAQAHFRCIGQARATAGARAGLVPHPLVRIGDLRQRRPRMPLLPTRLTPAPATQRLRSWLGERRVRRRWLRRVPATPPQLPAQLRHLGPKLHDHRPAAPRSTRQAPHRTGDDRQAPRHDPQPAAEINVTRRSSHNRLTSHTSNLGARAT